MSKPSPDQQQRLTPAEKSYIRQVAQAMSQAGLDPERVYAFVKTDGLLVAETNLHLISKEDLAAWQSAGEEYHQIIADGGDPWTAFEWARPGK